MKTKTKKLKQNANIMEKRKNEQMKLEILTHRQIDWQAKVR